MYAIIETGGKQYKVKVGDVVKVEKLDDAVGTSDKFEKVLAIFDGETSEFGTPYVAGASVSGTVVEQGKEKKVIVFKYKPKKTHKKKKGHRQPFTAVKIEAINR